MANEGQDVIKQTDAELTRLAAHLLGATDIVYARGESSRETPYLADNLPGKWLWRPGGFGACDFEPLTDWRAAGEIAEKMRADGWMASIAGTKDGYTASFPHALKGPGAGKFDPSFPRAITIAALLAVGSINAEQV